LILAALSCWFALARDASFSVSNGCCLLSAVSLFDELADVLRDCELLPTFLQRHRIDCAAEPMLIPSRLHEPSLPLHYVRHAYALAT